MFRLIRAPEHCRMNVAATATEALPRRAFTVDDIRRMVDAGILGEDEKLELIEGDVVMMAAKGVAHEHIKSALMIAIVRALPDHLTAGVETNLRLTDTVMLEPDLAVFPKDLFNRSASGFARIDPGEAYLIIEVAASSLAYDKDLKARLYARHQVRELWVIDASEQVTWVHTGPKGDGWSSIVKYGPNDALTTPMLPGFLIRVGEIG
jgi:Uma2 family endonuclease